MEMRTLRVYLAQGKRLYAEGVRQVPQPILERPEEKEGVDMVKTLTDEEIEKYKHEQEEFILNAWRKKGDVTDEEQTRDFINEFLYLLSVYSPMCLLRTIIDVNDLKDEFDKNWVLSRKKKVERGGVA